MIATQWKKEIQLKIKRQQELGNDGLLEEDCYLIECNLGDLEETSGIKKTYWILAIKAALEAGRPKGIQTQTVVAGQTTTQRDGHYLKQQLYGCIAIGT
jgi:hypothetical protein